MTQKGRPAPAVGRWGEGLVRAISSVRPQLGEVLLPRLGRMKIPEDFPGIQNLQKEFDVRKCSLLHFDS